MTDTHAAPADPAGDQLAAAIREWVAATGRPIPAHGEPGHVEAINGIDDTANFLQHAAAQVLPCLDCHGAFATHALGVAGLAILTAQVALSEYVPDSEWEWVGPDLQAASDLVTAAIAVVNGYRPPV